MLEMLVQRWCWCGRRINIILLSRSRCHRSENMSQSKGLFGGSGLPNPNRSPTRCQVPTAETRIHRRMLRSRITTFPLPSSSLHPFASTTLPIHLRAFYLLHSEFGLAPALVPGRHDLLPVPVQQLSCSTPLAQIYRLAELQRLHRLSIRSACREQRTDSLTRDALCVRCRS
jgi:hypothetical protein